MSDQVDCKVKETHFLSNRPQWPSTPPNLYSCKHNDRQYKHNIHVSREYRPSIAHPCTVEKSQATVSITCDQTHLKEEVPNALRISLADEVVDEDLQIGN
jgi:hypothetical protein